MLETIELHPSATLDDYAAYAHLINAVQELRAEAGQLLPQLAGHKVWMVNSTAKGGGVSEMLPQMVCILRELGLDIDWVVIGTDETPFFDLTKRIHNLIHGEGEPSLSLDDRALYDRVSHALAEEFAPRLSPGDILVVHDPQPCGMGALLKEEIGLHTVWRCHIGFDDVLPQTRAAWDLLRPYVEAYDHAVFSAPEYIPDFLTSNVSVIAPAIDPLQPKNRPLSSTELAGVLYNAGLMLDGQPVLTPPFGHLAERFGRDGQFRPMSEDPGLLPRPLVTQISRWDRLKGFESLMSGFVKLKRDYPKVPGLNEMDRRRFNITRLVLAGPEPVAIQDDPEASKVLEDICTAYLELEPELQEDILVLSLPMKSLRENALMVNALQLCSSVVAQNSLREGFGLTVTEAMWKRIPLLGSGACGIRQQIRDGIDGRLNHDPDDPVAVADSLLEILRDKRGRDRMGRSGQRRVYDHFLVFAQLRRWLQVLTTTVHRTTAPPARVSHFPD